MQTSSMVFSVLFSPQVRCVMLLDVRLRMKPSSQVKVTLSPNSGRLPAKLNVPLGMLGKLQVNSGMEN